MTITLKSAYEEFTRQAWSIFDTDIENIDDDDSGVINELKRALSELWNSFDFSFKLKQRSFITQKNIYQYSKPQGSLKKVFLSTDNNEEKELFYDNSLKTPCKKGIPEKFYVKFNKIFLNYIPDDKYKIRIEYLNCFPVLSSGGNSQLNFIALTDCIDIQEEYEDLFLRALISKTMSIFPHPNANINQAYIIKARDDYEALLNASDGGQFDKVKSW